MKKVLLSLVVFLPIAAVWAQPQIGATPGVFDFYLFTLSWSPEYCHSHAGDPECAAGNHFGFLVHGLWPQNKVGTFPEKCSTQPGPTNTAGLTHVMPATLINHEWTTHGTCSGLAANDYFALIATDFHSIHIPAAFVAPPTTRSVHPADIKTGFVQANPAIHNDGIAVNCTGNFLTALQICLAKDGTPISCPANVLTKDCRAKNITVPPVP